MRITMRLPRRLVVCVILCLLIPNCCLGKKNRKKKDKSSGKADHICRLTRGSKLTSFVKGAANVQLPCRYILTEFMCQSRTEVIAESSFSHDGRTYVSAVTVTMSRDVQNEQGKTVQESDVASIDMNDLKKFVDEGNTDNIHWTTSGQALVDVSSGGTTWRLQDAYDPDVGQAVLRDGSKNLGVYLSYVEGKTDKSKKGNLTVVCTSPNFKALSDSSGYLCGNAGNEQVAADRAQHIKTAAADLKLTTSQYLTYTVLVEQDVQQTNPMCKDASEVTQKCTYPVEAVKICSELLDSKTYSRCFMKYGIDPLEAYVQCVKWNCRRDVLSCRNLQGSLRTCPGGRKVKKYLNCGGGGY